MENNKRISELLVETKAYQDLDKPVILTSGELGIYYINTEKLVQDNGEFEKYGDDSQAMIKHAVKMMDEHPTFKEVIEILAEKVKSIVVPQWQECTFYVSGGQRRDWLFSGPVANVLDRPHMSLYKDGGRIDEVYPDGISESIKCFGETAYFVHVADLLTEGSSVCRIENNVKKGWLQQIEDGGGTIDNLVVVVDRNQGGKEMLDKNGVKVHSFVSIDEKFLGEYSKNPERAVAYLKNPKEWSQNYLKENGALALIDAFNPEGKKLDRARKFFDRYVSVLHSSNRLQELETAVEQKYSKPLKEIIGIVGLPSHTDSWSK